MRPKTVLDVIPGYHPIYRDAAPELIALVDDRYAHGCFREWASFTHSALALCHDQGGEVLTEPLARAVLELHQPRIGTPCARVAVTDPVIELITVHPRTCSSTKRQRRTSCSLSVSFCDDVAADSHPGSTFSMCAWPSSVRHRRDNMTPFDAARLRRRWCPTTTQNSVAPASGQLVWVACA